MHNIQQSFPDGRERLQLDLAATCVPIAAEGHVLLLSKQGTMDGSSFFGYYYSDNRMMDRLTLTVDGDELKLRSFESNIFEARYVYTNKDQTLLVDRRVVISSGFVERITLTGFSDDPTAGKRAHTLSIGYGADFRAMGEVRDMGPTGRGDMLVPDVTTRSVTFGWNGEDAPRRLTVAFTQTPCTIDAQHAEFDFELGAGETTSFQYSVSCRLGALRFKAPRTYNKAASAARAAYAAFRQSIPSIETGSQEFNELLEESLRGIYMLKYYAKKGECMAAGLPWYFCLFGRDICIWILQAGWLFPELAKSVLATLARYQATGWDEWTQARPGEIPHEVREDQLGTMEQIVYHNCCFAVDTAPLFIIATCKMAQWTGDKQFEIDMYSSLKRADACITSRMVEGLVVYDEVGRTNKFFMEEPRSVTDEFGVVPPAPKAVCDVQGFAWQARVLLGQLAARLGDTPFAAEKQEQADFQQAVFRRDFWDEEMQYAIFAIGGVGEKRHPCRVFQTDALLLPAGLLTAEQEQAIAIRAQKPDLMTPWGILPVSSKGRVYQPFFIQSQCVCPFQTVMGGVQWFLRTGHDAAAHQLMKGLVEAGRKLGHLPELFVVPNNEVGPLLYAASQMACWPQLWTCGAPLQMMQLCLDVKPIANGFSIDHASIPAWMRFVKVRGLRVQGQIIDLDYKVDGEGKTHTHVTIPAQQRAA